MSELSETEKVSAERRAGIQTALADAQITVSDAQEGAEGGQRLELHSQVGLFFFLCVYTVPSCHPKTSGK